MKIYKNIFDQSVSVENLLSAWHKFKQGKMKKKDVMEFHLHLEKNIFELHDELISEQYKHRKYHAFYIQDPKLRHIHKAEVRDRIVHQTIYTELTKIFEPTFIHDSYSCREGKGTHKAVKALEIIGRQMTHNYTAPCYVLKCDIRRFFDSVDHQILLEILSRKIKDERFLHLCQEIITSFAGYKDYVRTGAGIPIGNLTSQIFANIYLNELDQYLKQKLKEKFYIRYADDFVILSPDKKHLREIQLEIENFLKEKLRMELHPDKVFLRNFYQGIDFLGYILFPKHKVLRTKTKWRMLKKMDRNFAGFIREELGFESMNQVFQSYFGIMSHGNCRRLTSDIKKEYWIYSVLEYKKSLENVK